MRVSDQPRAAGHGSVFDYSLTEPERASRGVFPKPDQTRASAACRFFAHEKADGNPTISRIEPRPQVQSELSRELLVRCQKSGPPRRVPLNRGAEHSVKISQISIVPDAHAVRRVGKNPARSTISVAEAGQRLGQ